jgi:hypothetical protein
MSKEVVEVNDIRQNTVMGALTGMLRVGTRNRSAAQDASRPDAVTALQGRRFSDSHSAGFDRALSGRLDAVLYLEETAQSRIDRWLARLLRRRLEDCLPEGGR